MIATQSIDTRIYHQFIIIIKESKYFRKAVIEEVVLMYLLFQAAVRVAFIYQKYYSSAFLLKFEKGYLVLPGQNKP